MDVGTSGDAWQNVAASAGCSAAGIIIAFIGVAFPGPAQRTARPSRDGGNGLEHIFEHGAVVDIGASQLDGERCATPVRHQVAFGARLAAIRWIWARGSAPFGGNRR